ncbi:MAG TPA: nitroreductase family protein [Symbiobacteriaceae bacterium]|nr:nitroreductase family protein [Symbiobacteriaceae bacterium]
MNVTQQTTKTVQQAIDERRSIRRFQPEPIPQADLVEILRQAGEAPSAWNVQPWRYIVVTDPETKALLQEAAYGQGQVTSAPAVILVTSDMEDVMAHPEETVHPGMGEEGKARMKATLEGAFGKQSVEQRGQWGLTQTNIGLGFLMLAAQGMGYSSVPMLGFDQAKVRQILGLPEHVLFAAMLPIGKAAEEGHSKFRHPLAKIVSWR